MSWPTNVSPGQDIGSAQINDAYLAIRVWGGQVDAAGNDLINVGTLTSSSGLVRLESTLPQMAWKETDGGADAKVWKAYAESETFNFITANDAESAGTAWMTVTRSAATPTAILIPGSVSLGIGATPAAPLHVYRASTDEQIRFSNDLTNYYFLGRRASDGWCVLNGNQAAGFSGLTLAFASIEKFKFHGDGNVTIVSPLPGPYADNAAAVAAGLTAGRLYRDSSNNVKQVQ